MNNNNSNDIIHNNSCNNHKKLSSTSNSLSLNTKQHTLEKKQNNNNIIKNDNDVGGYEHIYIKNNPNPNLYDMRYYQRLNSSKRVSDLLGGLNVELENEDISNTDETTTSNNKELRVDRNKTISNMLKEFSKTNNENQQLKLEMQIQERKISNLEKDLKLYKSENINLKNQLEEKEKLSITVLKDKKQKTENLEFLYNDCQTKLHNEKEENKNLLKYIENLEKELKISKDLLKNRYISSRSNIL
jgi:hypothetical protein